MPKFVITPRNYPDGKLISIDPGVNGTGYAVWNSLCTSLEAPIESGTAKHKAKWWVDRALGIADAVSRIAKRHGCAILAIELPTFMEGGKGIVAARDGDLVTLSMAAGIIVRAVPVSHLMLITPNQWKGNMPKSVSSPRILERLEGLWVPSTKFDHEIDAVGIGLFAKGCL